MRESAPKVTCPMLEWEDIRTFFVRRTFIAKHTPELFDAEAIRAIRARQWDELPKQLRWELSIFIAGYKRAK